MCYSHDAAVVLWRQTHHTILKALQFTWRQRRPRNSDYHGLFCTLTSLLNSRLENWESQAFWQLKKLCGTLPNHARITWVIRLCTNLWSLCQLEHVLSLKQKWNTPNTEIFWNSCTFFQDATSNQIHMVVLSYVKKRIVWHSSWY